MIRCFLEKLLQNWIWKFLLFLILLPIVGMARVFAYLMQKDIELTDQAIFSDVSQTIKLYLESLYEESSSPKEISSRSLRKSILS